MEHHSLVQTVWEVTVKATAKAAMMTTFVQKTNGKPPKTTPYAATKVPRMLQIVVRRRSLSDLVVLWVAWCERRNFNPCQE